MFEQLAYAIVIGISASLPISYLLRYRRKERSAHQRLREMASLGLTEPVSLHPKIDPNRCIASGACVRACPEGEVLGMVNGRAELISPTRCIGHGSCQAACPVDAISLVFGTERRGVDIPHVDENFATNVPGIYIAGELGGMGLIRNAVAQGKEAMGYIARSLSGHSSSVHDVAIVGAGPAGFAATLQASKMGLDYVTLDQDDIGGTILSYPRQKIVMTQPMEIPLYGKCKFREIRKDKLLDLFREVQQRNGIEVRIHQKVEKLERQNGHFRVVSENNEYLAQRVLLAIGLRGSPRKLGVPGERTSKVAYKLIEPEQYRGKRVLVVGGGDSAVEAALALCAQAGTTVTISYRKGAFARIKEENRRRLQEAVGEGFLDVILESEVREIARDCVVIRQENRHVTVANDFVFIMIGGELPTAFLKNIGIQIETKYGER